MENGWSMPPKERYWGKKIVLYTYMSSYSNGDSREGNPGKKELNWERVPSPAPGFPWQGPRSTFSHFPQFHLEKHFLFIPLVISSPQTLQKCYFFESKGMFLRPSHQAQGKDGCNLIVRWWQRERGHGNDFASFSLQMQSKAGQYVLSDTR